ncbi:MAG: type I-E CRISPR-associated protein Cas6/Cse3/CasE, partial [Sedimenticola sp.]
MYFSRIRLRTDANTGSLAHQLCKGDSYKEHQMLWRLFDDDPNARRDFIFRRDDHNGWPLFYLVSKRIPKDQDNIWQIAQQAYSPKLHSGQKLAFSLRANPVITRKDPSGKQKRHDLIMDLKKQNGWGKATKSERSSIYELTQLAGKTWLTPRFEKIGAQLENLNADGYIQHRNHKKSQKKATCYSTLDLNGTLS